MHVALRDDDAGILVEFHRLTGLGTITPRPARRTSKPQVVWSVSNGLESLRLAELLERFPLRGRKRHEVATWSRAVRALEGGTGADLEGLSRQIRLLRRYEDPEPSAVHPPADEDGFVWYFGGFFTGEGSFHLSRKAAKAIIKLRRDDRPLLNAFAQITGLGRVYDLRPIGNDNPTAVWVILAQPELPATVDLLVAARLRGRKRREFDNWRIGVEEFVRAREEGRRRRVAVIQVASQGLRDARIYRQSAFDLSRDDLAEKREAFLGVLRAWASTATGPLTCTAYTQARRENRHWPTRNTVTLEFGSWAKALEAAGLARRAHPRSLYQSVLAGHIRANPA